MVRVLPQLVCAVLLGRDCPLLTQLLGKHTAEAVEVKAGELRDLAFAVLLKLFQEWQRGEPAFRHAWDMAVSKAEDKGATQEVAFLLEEGLLYRQGPGVARR